MSATKHQCTISNIVADNWQMQWSSSRLNDHLMQCRQHAQAANLLCTQADSASDQNEGFGNEGLEWLTGVVVCLLAASRSVVH